MIGKGNSMCKDTEVRKCLALETVTQQIYTGATKF